MNAAQAAQLDAQAVTTASVRAFLISKRYNIKGGYRPEKFDDAITYYSSNRNNTANHACDEFDVLTFYPDPNNLRRRSDRTELCLCTMPLRSWYLARNRITGTIVRVGSECQKKLEGPDGDLEGFVVPDDEEEDESEDEEEESNEGEDDSEEVNEKEDDSEDEEEPSEEKEEEASQEQASIQNNDETSSSSILSVLKESVKFRLAEIDRKLKRLHEEEEELIQERRKVLRTNYKLNH
jgi:hypothetical protein